MPLGGGCREPSPRVLARWASILMLCDRPGLRAPLALLPESAAGASVHVDALNDAWDSGELGNI